MDAILEMITAMQDLGMCVAGVLKDGKVDISDMGVLMGLLAKQSDFAAALKDAKSIPAEAKDLSDDQVVTLVKALLAAVHAVKAAA